MSYDYETTCPHCGLNHTIPYEDVRHHIYKILGQESARKRKDLPEHMRKMHEKNRQIHGTRLNETQVALLELAKREDLDGLKLREIADKVGVIDKNPVQHIWKQLDVLKKRGLLSVKRRMPAFQAETI
jgi:hypothetical protein